MMDGWMTTDDSAVSDFEEHLDGLADHAGDGRRPAAWLWRYLLFEDMLLLIPIMDRQSEAA